VRADVSERLCGGDEDLAPVEAVLAAAQLLAFARPGDRTFGGRARPRPAHALEGVARLGPEDPVGGDAGVALELGERRLGVGPEDAVLLAGIEAEAVETVLELGDVVAAQHRPAHEQHAAAEPERTLDQRVARLFAADAVDPESAAFLEGAHLRLGRCAEPSGLVARDRESERGEPLLQLAHCVPLGAATEGGGLAQPASGRRSDVTVSAARGVK
jgi:hypothetical protein